MQTIGNPEVPVAIQKGGRLQFTRTRKPSQQNQEADTYPSTTEAEKIDSMAVSGAAKRIDEPDLCRSIREIVEVSMSKAFKMAMSNSVDAFFAGIELERRELLAEAEERDELAAKVEEMERKLAAVREVVGGAR